MTDLVGAWADERPDDVVAVERHGRRRSLTVGALVARAERLAAGLVAAGASAERPIIGWLPNRLEWVELIAAAGRLGAPIVGLNTRYRSDELRHVLQRSNAGVLVAVDEFAGIRFGQVAAPAGRIGLLSVVVADGTVDPAWAELGCPVTAWDELAVDAPASHAPVPSDFLIAFTTSGTTGFPKLAVHDQAGVVGHALDDAAAFDVRPGDRLLLDLPLCGTFGFSSLLAALGGRATTLLDERFDPRDSARAIAEEAITHYNASDDMVLHVLDTGLVRGGEHVWREGALANFANAARTAADRAERIGVRLTGVYGMSEVFALLARWPATMDVAARSRSGGIPVGGTEVRVIDPDDGAVQAVGVDGELCFRGPVVLRRYLGDDAATAAALGDDGWFRSGDLGRLTGDGGFEFLARLGDSLRLRGFLVDPAEIEQRLETHAAVGLAQVVAAERPGRGQVAVAFVRLSEPASEEELRQHCAAGLADFKVPERIVAVDEFPTVDGPNGVKILKRDLRAMAQGLVS